MKININKQAVDVPRETNLLQIAERKEAQELGYVIALNDCVIPKGRWQQTMLTEGDQISIFSVIAGG